MSWPLHRSRILWPILTAFLVPFVATTSATAQGSLDLGIHGTGLSIGNSPRWRGLRLNLVDGGVDRIDGLNVILLSLTRDRDARYRGIHASVIGGDFRSVSGLNISFGGAQAVEHLSGISVGGIAEVVDAQGNKTHRGHIQGLTAAGLFVVSSGAIAGISAAGIAVYSHESMSGLTIAGLAAISDSAARGLLVAGFVVGVDALRGAGFSVGAVDARDLHGLAAASYVHARRATGITIAVFNRVENLHGVEVGVLNYAGNNHGWKRWLPVLNAHF